MRVLAAALLGIALGCDRPLKRRLHLPMMSNSVRYGQLENFISRTGPPADTEKIDLDVSLMVLYQLTVNVNVGTPPQTIPLVLDTSIENTFIPSPNCTAPSCTYLSLNSFNKDQSSTYIGTGINTNMTVGDYVVTIGQFTGEVGQDIIKMDNVTFDGPFLYVDNTVSPEVKLLMYNGRLGLGWPYPAEPQNPEDPSWLPELFANFPNKVYSFYMHNYQDYGVIGGFEVGGYDSSIIDDHTLVTYPNYLDAGYWAVNLNNVYVDDLELGYNGWAVVDIATPFITCPLVSFSVLAEVLELDTYGTLMNSSQTAAQYYNIPCSNAQFLKPVTLVVNGVPYTLPPESYLIGNGVDCVSIFYGHDVGQPMGTAWVFGNSFFRERMAIFDYDANTISWATLK